MYSLLRLVTVSSYLTATLVAAQFFPPTPEGIRVLKSKFHHGVTISYKEPEICETTEGVKSYSGYIHLPPKTVDEAGELQDYPINTFFWFFESRKDPHNAPLSIWLNGGPGGSSLIGLLRENGPCFVGDDSNSTYLNPWSWNNEVNMLYIDQPVQVGYSYDTLVNGTLDYLKDGNITIEDFSQGVPQQNNTLRVGTFASQNVKHTANSSIHAAHAIWHFAQTFLEEFPKYEPHDERISLWTESYGGKYGPVFAEFFRTQNERIINGSIRGPGTHLIHLDTVGIINGCIDSLYQARKYPIFLYNNTYGIQAINVSTYKSLIHEFDRPNGLQDQFKQCRQMARQVDPDEHGDIDEVNKFCAIVQSKVEQLIYEPFKNAKEYGWMDITHPWADPFPTQSFIGFLNQPHVQKALGVPVNFSESSMAVSSAFASTGDEIKSGMLPDMEHLLDSGVKVSLMYGDRDYACNWVGGEEAAMHVEYSSSKAFRNAGYAPIAISPFYSGGQVRQHGNLSFSRVYQAGHMVPSYQPETAYEIFMRTMFNRDVATGQIHVEDDYSTVGPRSTFHIKNDVLPAPKPECYILAPLWTCTDEQYAMVKNNTAVVKDYKVVGSVAQSVDSNTDRWVAGYEVDQRVLRHRG
ncbi:hypothetical protein MMC18_003186 [Xylographa bjoerkii]|nr:hypothetical protein [Xylographa bjoerkii]